MIYEGNGIQSFCKIPILVTGIACDSKKSTISTFR